MSDDLKLVSSLHRWLWINVWPIRVVSHVQPIVSSVGLCTNRSSTLFSVKAGILHLKCVPSSLSMSNVPLENEARQRIVNQKTRSTCNNNH